MVQVYALNELVCLPHTVEVVLGGQLVAQGVLPVRPGQSAFLCFLQKDAAVSSRSIAQLKRVTCGLDEQFSQLHAHSLRSLGEGDSRLGRPVTARDRIGVRHPSSVEPPVRRHPGVADYVGEERGEDQVRTLKRKDDVSATLVNRAQPPQGPYCNRHTIPPTETERGDCPLAPIEASLQSEKRPYGRLEGTARDF